MDQGCAKAYDWRNAYHNDACTEQKVREKIARLVKSCAIALEVAAVIPDCILSAPSLPAKGPDH